MSDGRGGERPDSRFSPPASFWLIVAGAVAVMLLLFWHVFHGRVAAWVIAWKHLQLSLLGELTARHEALHRALPRLDPERLTLVQTYWLFDVVGDTVRLPAAGVLALLALVVFVAAPSRRFRGRLTPDAVFRMQPEHLRCAGAYLDRPLDMVAPREGAPRPTDFALHDPEWILRHAWGPTGFREDRCRRALARQLGPVWAGVEAAPGHARVLFAAFALHAARQRVEAALFLGEVVRTLPPGPVGEHPVAVSADALAAADRVIADPDVAGVPREIAARHAFLAPALMSVLQHARDRSGVLAPAFFNWLKMIDRDLWYALHSLGMPNPYVEARGSRDHWAAERALGRPIPVPRIDGATASVRARVKDVRAP